MKGGRCDGGPPVYCQRPPSGVWRPPSVCLVVVLNGGGWCVCVVPVLVLGPALYVVLFSLVLFSLAVWWCGGVCRNSGGVYCLLLIRHVP